MTISAKIGENVAKNIKTLNSLPRDYKKTINKIIDLINTARQKTLRVVNRSRIDLYWQIGSIIVQRQENFKWGEEVVEYISLDLQSRFPNLKGVSSRNLWRMRNFYLIYRNESELQSLCKEVGWSHNNAILDLTENRQEKEFYLRMCLRERWTVKELKKQIGSNLFSRYALAKEPEKILQDTLRKENNLDHHFKDEYLFDFLNLSSGYSEKDLCKALTIHMRNFLRELGRGFMFGGDEYNLRVGNEEFRIDMLFFHRELRCLIAVEFKKEHLDDFDYRDNIEQQLSYRQSFQLSLAPNCFELTELSLALAPLFLRDIYMKSFMIALIVVVICSCNEQPQQVNRNTKKPSFAWPPILGKEFPNLQLYNHKGEFVRLNKFKGKIIVVEPIGMNCPACNAFAGANDKNIGKFSGISPQTNLPSFKEALKTYGGVDFAKEDIVYVHLLLYDLQMKAPTQQDAKNWAQHFAISKNEMVLVGTKEMQGQASYRMIPGFYLLDENFVVVSDSTGHHPKNNLYTQLIPHLQKLLRQQKQHEQAFYEIYPKNTDAPRGTKYPCAFAPLPSHLKGIPSQDRTFVTKFFAHVVQAIHARLRMHQVFYDAHMNRKAQLQTYNDELQKIVSDLQNLQTPHQKLKELPQQIINALLLQQKAYTALVEKGAFSQQDAKAGSRILLNSWQQVSRYYNKMNPEVKNAVYHHLCALDIYQKIFVGDAIMGLSETFLGLKQYTAQGDINTILQSLQKTNPKTAKALFRVVHKNNMVKLIADGFWNPHITVEESPQCILFTFVVNKKLQWTFRCLFEGIIAACVAIILTYFIIPLAAPIVYASILAVILPTVIFIGAIIFIGIIQRECMRQMVAQVNDLLKEKLRIPQQKMAKRSGSRSWLGAILPSLLGIGLALLVAVGTHSLAWKYWCKGEYAKSENLCRPVQMIVHYTLGENNSIAADTNYYLAECLRCQGKNEEAIELYQRSLRQIETFLGDRHFYIADNCYNLARVYDAQKKYPQAQQYYEKAIKTLHNQYPTFLGLARMRNRLAIVLLKQGDISGAEQEQREAIRIDRLYGKTQGVAENLNDLGCILYHKNELQAATEIFAESLDLKMHIFGKKHYTLYATLYNLYLLNDKLQQHQQAQMYRNWAQECFTRWFRNVKKSEGKACAQYIAKVYHYMYEVPHFFSRCNVILSLEGNY